MPPKWYRSAEICFVYLEDVDGLVGCTGQMVEQLRPARWFTRGWTLQELIAPPKVVFYNRSWASLGTRDDLAEYISAITGIDRTVLVSTDPEARPWERFPVAQRMAWLASRSTTRIEDMAYCMLGIFNIQMPLLYGEGGRAFVRLQEEIIKVSYDQTLFSWTAGAGDPNPEALFRYGIPAVNILATTARAFEHCNRIRIMPSSLPTAYSLTNVGLHITLPYLRLWGQANYIVVLQACDGDSALGIVVFWHIPSGRFVRRSRPTSPVILSPGFRVAGFRQMDLDRDVVNVTARTRGTPPNQSGDDTTHQNKFGLLLTFSASDQDWGTRALVAEGLRTWPNGHFDESTSILEFPADSDSMYWQPVPNINNATARVGGVVVWIRPHTGVPFRILFRLTIATSYNSEETSSRFGWSPADDLFNTNANEQLFTERLQELGMRDLGYGSSYFPLTTSNLARVSISHFDTDFPPYRAVRHAYIHL